MSTFQMHAPADLAFETTLLVRDTCLCCMRRGRRVRSRAISMSR